MLVKPMYRPFPQNNRLLWAFLLILGLGVGVQAQSLINTAHVVDSAGGASESASYRNISAVGQPFGFDENSSATYFLLFERFGVQSVVNMVAWPGWAIYFN
jgi:hypothetical protein